MDRGFTLIELLVTVAVIGLLAGLAMLQARPNDGQQSLERAGNTLNGAVRLAQTQALADGQVLALKVTEEGYEFTSNIPETGPGARSRIGRASRRNGSRRALRSLVSTLRGHRPRRLPGQHCFSQAARVRPSGFALSMRPVINSWT